MQSEARSEGKAVFVMIFGCCYVSSVLEYGENIRRQ
jgi:hypothetical protein